ncbi:hypothetical protein GWI33_001741 [Rhynchophorus ferrugineus]|uniref:Uncharacterized protein n=1 Tax=Rhynchophorus ferrugineus TaxID=354439 RepID=A0A834MNE9_RHYFE|nr:hypothetical protein GWI33_001741 [Rhynchophorus ferrugineus]
MAACVKEALESLYQLQTTRKQSCFKQRPSWIVSGYSNLRRHDVARERHTTNRLFFACACAKSRALMFYAPTRTGKRQKVDVIVVLTALCQQERVKIHMNFFILTWSTYMTNWRFLAGDWDLNDQIGNYS